MTDVTSRTDFVHRFAFAAETVPDTISALIESIDCVEGITSRTADPELYFSFVLDGIAHPLIIMETGDSASVYICPSLLKEFLLSHGRFPFEADDFLAEVTPFVSKTPGRPSAYPYGSKFYLNIETMLDHSASFVSIVNKFVRDIYYTD